VDRITWLKSQQSFVAGKGVVCRAGYADSFSRAALKLDAPPARKWLIARRLEERLHFVIAKRERN